jgi:hypothetical protein
MRLSESLGVVGLVIGLASPLMAAEETMEKLANRCKPVALDIRPVTGDMALCVGYFAGVLDTLHLAEVVLPGSTKMCLPEEGLSRDQAVKIFLKWAQEHPESLHEPAVYQVSYSLLQSFPCRGK